MSWSPRGRCTGPSSRTCEALSTRPGPGEFRVLGRGHRRTGRRRHPRSAVRFAGGRRERSRSAPTARHHPAIPKLITSNGGRVSARPISRTALVPNITQAEHSPICDFTLPDVARTPTGQIANTPQTLTDFRPSDEASQQEQRGDEEGEYAADCDPCWVCGDHVCMTWALSQSAIRAHRS